MKTIEEAHKSLDQWFDGGCVGNFIAYRAPFKNHVSILLEETIKSHEMNEQVAAAFSFVMEQLDCDRGEMFTDKDGRPDRVRVVREFG